MKITSLLVAVSILASAGSVAAQTTAAPSAKIGCAPTQAKPNDPDGLNTTGKDRPLTERLAETGGVLCPPPAVDSDIRVPAPKTDSNMPVLPPPSTSTNPSPQPK